MERAVPFRDGSGNLHRPARRSIVPSRVGPVPQKNMVLDAEAEEPPAFASLTAYLLCIVAKKLDAQSLASFAAACSECRAVAHEPLHEALLQVLLRTNHCEKHCSRC